MREILFRGKSPSNGEWVSGYLVSEKYIGNFLVCEPVIPDTIGQYTGLTDKNGRKIFEGDVVKDDSGVVYPVVFCLTGFCLKYAPPHSCGFRYDLLPLSNYWHAHGAIIEVIGNIHDNPELLEVSGDG